MTLPVAPARASLRALAAAVVATLGVAAPAYATDPEVANFDARPDAVATPAPAGERSRDRLRDRLGRFGALSLDDQTGTVRSVGRLDGFLTGPSARDGAAIALDYVRDHATAFGLDGNDLQGLRLIDRSFVDGVEHLSWEQRFRGIPVADAGLDAAVTGAGRLLNVTGPPAPDLAVRSTEPTVGAADAYAAARESGGDSRSEVDVAASAGDAEQLTRFSDGGRASLTLYHAADGYRLAWRALAPVSSTGVYDVLVDARSGEVVRRANRVNFANAWVFEYSPAAGPQKTNQEFPASWLTSTNALSGSNAHAFVDELDHVPFRPGSTGFELTPEAGSDVGAQGGAFNFGLQHVTDQPNDGCPPSSTCTWDDDIARSWDINRAQSATQLFYLVNVFHDYLRNDPDIAFTDGAFERTGKALGDPDEPADPTKSDPVLAQTLDGAAIAGGFPDFDHSNNSSFLTLPDGYPGLLQSHLWELPFGGYDGANDASLVFHEYTHGVTNRLITDAAGFGALNTAQAGAMGEGWSDFYAMDYLEAESLEQDDPGVGDVRLGRYLDNGTGELVRFQPIDCEPSNVPVSGCPDGGTSDPQTSRDGGFTYADFGNIHPEGAEVHADGEIWAQTLWSIRQAIGVAKARRYVTDAMRLSPPEPSFLDMRNAMLEASSDADDDLIWTVFAARGMGYFAGSDGSNDATPVADFTDPATLTQSGSISGSVNADEGPLAGATVGIAGFDDGLGPQHVATTGAGGAYSIDDVPTDGVHSYPTVRARKPGFKGDQQPNVTVPDTGVDFTLERDWSSAAPETAPAIAKITSFTGPDNTDSGCGPAGLIDDQPGVVWGTSDITPLDNSSGQELVVELGAPIDVGAIEIDPSAGCGDSSSAALGSYEVLAASSPGGPFRSLASNAFGAGDLGRLNRVFAGDSLGVRYIKLRANSSQVNNGSGYMDVAELHVARKPGSPIGAAADTGLAQGIGQNGATLTGSVVPHGGSAQVIFEYGTTASNGAAIAAGPTPAGEASTPVAAAIGGLQPSTTYHFRVVALRDGRRYEGGDETFTTAAAPSSPPPPPPAPTPTPGPIAKVTSLSGARLTADRKGLFKVKVRFGDAAPVGRARITVSRKGKRLARASTPVRQGKTVTKTLRLSRKGRKVIRRGRTRNVKVQLRLPGGEKLTKTVKLTRKRR